MSRYRLPNLRQGLFAGCFGLAAAACGTPDLNTDLRSAGPPDVLAVLTQNPIDWDGNTLTESALKCRYVDGKRDPKAPGFVGDPITGGSLVCPETEAEFNARDDHQRSLEPRLLDGTGWAIRVMYDELLDGDLVETLICDEEAETCEGSLDDTQPFTLTCGSPAVELGYTGYYVPNGNNVTFPLGPSLFLRPNADELVFPTGSPCNLTMDPNRIKDKDGESVTAADADVDLKIADLALMAIDPPEGADAVVPPNPGGVAFVFNAGLESDEDGAAVDHAMFQLKDGAGADIDTWTAVDSYNSDLPDAVYIFPDTATGIFTPGSYTATMKAGTLTELNGGTLNVAADTSTHFSVGFARTGQTSGTDLPVNGLIRVSFNNTIDMASVDATDYELFQTNPPTNMAIPFTVAVGNTTSAALNNIANNALVFTPTSELPIGAYALRIKAGTEVKDIATPANTAKFAAALATTYNVLLKASRSIPANAAALPAANDIQIVMTGSLDPASVTDADFTLVDMADMSAVPFAVSIGTSPALAPPAIQPHANDMIIINPNANLTAGHTYILTIKQGAAIKSANGVTRTFAAPPGTSTNRTQWTFTAS